MLEWNMNTIRLQNNLFLVFLLLVSFSVFPSLTEAQYSGGSSYRSKVNKLDNDVVKNLPIPILFGIELKDITPNFGDPRDGGSRKHEGLDIMAPEGALIVSPTEAVVTRTGTGSGSGKYVTTANPGGETFIYMHLSKILVKNGQVLKEGDLIGYVGDTGNAKGGPAHLHFEIRKSRKPTDPYIRITEEFTLKEKINYLDDILDDAKDEDDFIEFLVDEYLGVFYQARAQGITLPKVLVNELPLSAGAPIRDLGVGSEGADVMALQSVLIAEGYLVIEAPTNTFGPRTESALREYQVAHGITPANGYYGPVTRAFMQKGTVSTPTKPMTTAEMNAKILELTALLKKLKAQQ